MFRFSNSLFHIITINSSYDSLPRISPPILRILKNAAQSAASDFAKGIFSGKDGNAMASYIAPEVKERFNSLSPELRNCILDRNVELRTVHDLIRVLEDIVNEGER